MSLVSLDSRWLSEVGLPISVIRGVVAISGIYNLHAPMTLQNKCSVKYFFFYDFFLFFVEILFFILYM